jgi:hypothetical protein
MRRSGSAAAASIAAFLCGAAGAQAQTTTFDGNWSVQVLTDRGDCDRAYRYPVTIQNGRVRYGGPEALKISGQVGGAVRGSILPGQLIAIQNEAALWDGSLEMGNSLKVPAGERLARTA